MRALSLSTRFFRSSSLWLSFTLCIVVLVLMSRNSAAQADGFVSVPEAALLTAAEVNQTRLENGMMPLQWSDALAKMAMDQATYVAANLKMITAVADSTNDFKIWHQDEYARDQLQRGALFWPNYGLPAQVVIGENALNYSRKKAVQWWMGDPIHKCTLLDPRFRETGVAALKMPDGSFVIYQAFGARPKVWPALIDPTTNTLYLSAEVVSYAADAPTTGTDPAAKLVNLGCNRLSKLVNQKTGNALRFELTDLAGQPLSNQTAYSPLFPLKMPLTAPIIVQYDMPDKTIFDVFVTPGTARNMVLLPHTLALYTQALAAAPAETPAPAVDTVVDTVVAPEAVAKPHVAPPSINTAPLNVVG